MKRDYLAAFFAFWAIVLDIIVSPVRTFLWEEKQVLEGGEYDEEADDQEQGTQETDSGDQLQA